MLKGQRGAGRVQRDNLVAPGNRVISLDVRGSLLDTMNGGANQISGRLYRTNKNPHASPDYFCLSGTSMAAPVVAGAAALLLQKDPTLTPDTVKARLMFTADKWAAPDGSSDPCTYGAGYLNIPAALGSRVVAARPALSPSLSRGPLGTVYIQLGPALAGGNGLWGTGAATAQPLLGALGLGDPTGMAGTQVLWGNQMLWGEGFWDDRSTFPVPLLGLDLSPVVTRGE